MRSYDLPSPLEKENQLGTLYDPPKHPIVIQVRNDDTWITMENVDYSRSEQVLGTFFHLFKKIEV